MEQRIVIRNFGPIKEIDLPIRDLTILIGPNASGKSLVGKLVYYFQTVWQKLAEKTYFDFLDLLEKSWKTKNVLQNPRLTISPPELYGIIWSYYTEVVGAISLDVVFYFAEGRMMPSDASRDDHWKSEFNAFINDLSSHINEELIPIIREYPLQFPQDGKQRARVKLYEAIEASFADFFGISKHHSTLLVPPGRNQLIRMNMGALRGKLTPDVKLFDFFANEYLQWLEDVIKPSLKGGELNFNSAQQTQFNRFQPAYWEMFFAQMKQVVKADIQIDVFDDEVYLLSGKSKISIRLGSAGQQEATGIFLVLIWLMNEFEKKQENSLLILEEPEAHLFPEVQENLVNALALFLNVCPGSQLFINTHSPYILSSLDNLIQAESVARQRPEAVDAVKAIVPEEFWVDYDKVSAYYLDETGITDIRDKEWKSLGANRIDDSSEEIAKVFENLLDLKYAKTQ